MYRQGCETQDLHSGSMDKFNSWTNGHFLCSFHEDWPVFVMGTLQLTLLTVVTWQRNMPTVFPSTQFHTITFHISIQYIMTFRFYMDPVLGSSLHSWKKFALNSSFVGSVVDGIWHIYTHNINLTLPNPARYSTHRTMFHPHFQPVCCQLLTSLNPGLWPESGVKAFFTRRESSKL